MLSCNLSSVVRQLSHVSRSVTGPDFLVQYMTWAAKSWHEISWWLLTWCLLGGVGAIFCSLIFWATLYDTGIPGSCHVSQLRCFPWLRSRESAWLWHHPGHLSGAAGTSVLAAELPASFMSVIDKLCVPSVGSCFLLGCLLWWLQSKEGWALSCAVQCKCRCNWWGCWMTLLAMLPQQPLPPSA